MNDLIHVGVKGMRWGKRKNRNAVDWEKVSKLKKKKVSELTDEELKLLTSRMNLEKQYKQLNPGKIRKGEKAVSDIIGGMGKISAAAAGVATMVALGKKLMALSPKP